MTRLRPPLPARPLPRIERVPLPPARPRPRPSLEHTPVIEPSSPYCIHTFPDGSVCGYPELRHLRRDRSNRKYPARPGRPQKARQRAPRKERVYSPYVSENAKICVGIDGEGQGRAPHLYTYMAAVDEEGEVRGELRNRFGIGTKEALDWFLNLADLGVSRVFGFSIGYDLTKILADLSDKKLYLLNRPEKRKLKRSNGRTTHKAIDWRGFRLAYMRGQLIVRRVRWDVSQNRSVAYGPSITIWDVFRFFQSKFTTALIDWKIADKKSLEGMAAMKDKRSTFDELSQKDVEDYCKDECHHLARLVRKLIEAHEDCELKLKYFFGAGSTATALMQKLEIKTGRPGHEGGYIAPPPPEMRHAVACGFAGGRFEISRVGPVKGPVYNYDISSAYPYHITFLPCLAHGAWSLVKKGKELRGRIERARLALVHSRVRVTKNAPEAWGPFPFRTEDATILFPASVGGVWTWKDEFLTAERLFPGVEPLEAWVFESTCDHRPFESLPEIYRQRVLIGKEGKGIVLKLGPNSLYGKTAQSVGDAPFQSFVWAGNITSNTRAQLLDAAFSSLPQSEWWNLLMFATDGIFSSVPLKLPAPRDTETWELPCPPDKDGATVAKKPLGGWETNEYKRGIFLLRPGVYFPLESTEADLKEVKARGMSKAVLLRCARTHVTKKGETVEGIEEFYARTGGEKPYSVRGLERFVGMLTAVQKGGKEGPKRSEEYGEWVEYPVECSFTPLPKRMRVLPDRRLEMFRRMAGESMPYKKANRSPEAEKLQEAEDIFSEQSDGDFCFSEDYG